MQNTSTGQQSRTKVCRDSQFPEWGEFFVITVRSPWDQVVASINDEDVSNRDWAVTSRVPVPHHDQRFTSGREVALDAPLASPKAAAAADGGPDNAAAGAAAKRKKAPATTRCAVLRVRADWEPHRADERLKTGSRFGLKGLTRRAAFSSKKKTAISAPPVRTLYLTVLGASMLPLSERGGGAYVKRTLLLLLLLRLRPCATATLHPSSSHCYYLL